MTDLSASIGRSICSEQGEGLDDSNSHGDHDAPVRCRFKALDVEGLRLTQPPLQRRFVVKVLREAGNKGTLRAFRNADRFTTFKIFRWLGAL
jgi:hypothetical protein